MNAVCKHCGNENVQEGWKFCPACGQAITKASSNSAGELAGEYASSDLFEEAGFVLESGSYRIVMSDGRLKFLDGEDNDEIDVQETSLYRAVCQRDGKAVDAILAALAYDRDVKADYGACRATLQETGSLDARGRNLSMRYDLNRCLLLAVHADDRDMVLRLIAKGANPDLEDYNEGSPLHVAVKKGNPLIVSDLIAAGADIDNSHDTEATPLITAIIHNQPNIAALLLVSGADVNSQDDAENTALIHALDKGHFDLAELLLMRGADATAAAKCECLDGSYDETPALSIAAQKGNIKLVKLLLAKGAQVNAVDENQKTALSYAEEEGQEEIVRELMQHGAERD